MKIDDLDEYITSRHTHDLFRLQTLTRYDVESDGGDYQRYLSGEAAPEPEAKTAWLEELKGLVHSGRQWRNVHVVQLPLTDYLRYQFEWGYVYNTEAGQQIRIINADAELKGQELLELGDFFVIDQGEVLEMIYDDEGRFEHASHISDEATAQRFRDAAHTAWKIAVPFTEWWKKHPEYHRAVS